MLRRSPSPAPPAARRRAIGDRGTVLTMMPAAVLILFLLAAIAADNALVFVSQRQVFHQAEAAANDASVAGLDIARARADGGDLALLGEGAITTIVEQEFAALDAAHGAYTLDRPSITFNPGTNDVTITVTAHVKRIFTGIAPGVDETATVKVTVTATGKKIVLDSFHVLSIYSAS